METYIKNLLIAESTYVDFKVSLEKAKPKSWLKTVVAFANGIGGSILFGVDDDRNIVGLEDIHGDAEKISNLIKTKIDPILMFELKPVTIEEKQILALNIPSGKMTPYYYVNEGTRTAFVRIGNESVIAPSYIIHELTLKGQRLSFDALSTNEKFSDASFTLFKSIFFKVSGKRIEGRKDYLSFGMIDKNDHLTYAGLLLSDECTLLQSRIFCTRWTGTSKGKRSVDAIDDKEYNGNIIMLLKEATSFVKNNSKKAWKIEGLKRIEFIDYPEDAVREAIVNALVHRDYNIIGSEIHIDIYDDRLEIVSPGGMYDGKNIQEVDIDKVASIRRNPIVADIFNRLDYMERRGSGLKRIRESFKDENLVEFYSNQSSFYVVMKKQTANEIEDMQDERLNERIKSEYERIMSGLNNNEKLIVDFLIENQRIANKQAIEITGLSSAQVRRVFVSLQHKGIIEAHGKGRGRYYILVKE
ncbi:MAG: putative DNA binding domain-containing protein [Clostridiales bacterium]|nr:putative DNA binding domain-containing protein [Clostridiales bacterium]